MHSCCTCREIIENLYEFCYLRGRELQQNRITTQGIRSMVRRQDQQQNCPYAHDVKVPYKHVAICKLPLARC